MGGQVAEELFFGDISTGPAGDLLYATDVASHVVGSAGMMGKVVSLGAIESGSLNGTNIVGRVLGDSEGREMVESLLQQQQRAAVVEIMAATGSWSRRCATRCSSATS